MNYKELILKALEAMAMHWRREGVHMGFGIHEMINYHAKAIDIYVYLEPVVEGRKIIIHTESRVVVGEETIFDVLYQMYKRILNQMLLAGVTKEYEITVQLGRDHNIRRNLPANMYPMTPQEVTKKHKTSEPDKKENGGC